jgi:hypothetical protein
MGRFGLHLAAAAGAVGVFAAAAVVGASQMHPPADISPQAVATVVRPRAGVGQRPTVVATPAVETATPAPRPRAGGAAVRPERSLAGTIESVGPDSLQVVGVGGRTWTIEPAAGALIRLDGKAAKLDSLQPGDGVVILGQAQAGPGLRFLAHAITAKAR